MEKHVISNATKFLNFLNKNPTPYHVVESSRQMLVGNGFTELKMSEPWETKPGGNYFVTKNESTLIAFSIGGTYQPGNGFCIVGAHTDSPCLKLKAVTKRAKAGYLQVGVQCYGGGIWHSWFDRDLTVAGRVLIDQPNGQILHKLVHLQRPLLRVPNLAIHLDRTTNEKFGPNKETHLQPILALAVQDQLLTDAKADKSAKHHSILLDLLSKELNCKPEDINDIELSLADCQQAVLGGVNEEFIFGGRLDNQVGAYCSIHSLIEASKAGLEKESNIRIAAIYDHEEVGSESAQGAASSITEHILRRLTDPTKFELAVSRSFFISADQAHAVHPNYAEVHHEDHRPSMNGGVVLKQNGNQRYTTNAVTASVLREVSKITKVPMQDFMVKNDCACGSTIGPILSAKLGMTAVDIGMPQLAMHSIREMGSTLSITQYNDFLTGFFNHYTPIMSKFSSFL